MPETRLQTLNRAYGLGASSIAAAWSELEVPVQWAALQQFRTNDAGDELPPYLEDIPHVPLTRPRPHSTVARSQIVNRGTDRGRLKSRADLKKWRAGVDQNIPWAYEVQDELRDRGVPFDLALLHSLEINLSGVGPLFSGKALPDSLLPFGNQAGERECLRLCTAEEVMLQYLPHDYALNKRPAGSAAPPGYEAGLTFGSPVFSPALGRYIKSPIMDEPAYARYRKTVPGQ
jgi:hypothetical protein